MAVFTEVEFGEADALVQRLGLGPLRELRGIEGGIENTNYFATTESGEYVLTLFERLSAEQLPYYLCLMKHLAARGLPVPEPVADPAVQPIAAQDAHPLSVPANAPCELLLEVAGKPAALVRKLAGRSELPSFPTRSSDVIAIVALEEGVRAMMNLRGAEPAKVAIGMPVEIFFEPAEGSEYPLPQARRRS